MSAPISFRRIRPDDDAFLFRVYASTREEELALVNWDPAAKEAFLQMQFGAQHQFYQSEFSSAAFELVLKDDTPIGRLYVDRRPDEIRIIDIALLPEFRNAGIGSALLEDLQSEAARVGKPLRIHVERYNRALLLYQRLGFREIDRSEIHLLMEWTAERETGRHDPDLALNGPRRLPDAVP
jgi:ribosomal protein S18 acetylase RimI-like enzyme